MGMDLEASVAPPPPPSERNLRTPLPRAHLNRQLAKRIVRQIFHRFEA